MTERAFKGILILLTLIGLMVFFQGRAWAGIYVAYDSNPMMVLDGANCAGGVTEAIKNNPGARIVFESTGGGSAESTIGAYSGGTTYTVVDMFSDTGFDNAGEWTCGVGSVISGSSLSSKGTVFGEGAYPNTITSALEAGALLYLEATCTFYNGAGYWRLIYSDLLYYATGTVGVFRTTTSAIGTAGMSYRISYNNVDITLSEYFARKILSPGPNGCLLGPVTTTGSFNPNAITKFKIIRPVSGNFFGWTRTGRVVWDSSVD